MIFRIVCVLASLCLAACSSPVGRSVKDKPNRSNRIQQISQPTMSLPPQDLSANAGVRWPAGMRRLAVLPIFSNRPIDQTQRDMDGIFRAELSKVVKYEIVQVNRSDMASLMNREAVSSSEIIPSSVIAMLRQKYGADAVLFTDFTLFRPYRPLAIGVRSKIVDLKTMDILWMADGILDSAEPDVSELATQFSDSGLQMRYISSKVPKGREREKGSGNQIILQSPRLYATFVAHEAFSSLSPVPSAATTPQ
ncbi:MAG: hypothetical protein WCG66_01880 [bacterium]